MIPAMPHMKGSNIEKCWRPISAGALYTRWHGHELRGRGTQGKMHLSHLQSKALAVHTNAQFRFAVEKLQQRFAEAFTAPTLQYGVLIRRFLGGNQAGER